MSIPSDWMADALIRDMRALAARAERLASADYSLSPAALDRLAAANGDVCTAVDFLILTHERRLDGRAE